MQSALAVLWMVASVSEAAVPKVHLVSWGDGFQAPVQVVTASGEEKREFPLRSDPGRSGRSSAMLG